MNPFAPITPEQEAEIRRIAAAEHSRHRKARILDGLTKLDYGQAAERLRRLKGEPEPPFVPAPPADPAATRAAAAATKERLEAHFAGRRMQDFERGLQKPSLYAGFNGNPHSMNR